MIKKISVYEAYLSRLYNGCVFEKGRKKVTNISNINDFEGLKIEYYDYFKPDYRYNRINFYKEDKVIKDPKTTYLLVGFDNHAYYNPFKDVRVSYHTLEIGQKLYFNLNDKKCGQCKVDKIYDYYNEDGLLNNKICDVIMNDEIITVYRGNVALFYNWNDNPLEVYNESKNEFLLLPIAEHSEKGINIYWKTLAEASQYIVKLYKIINKTNEIDWRIYHINDYIVDHNSHMLSINNLSSSKDLIAVVYAENRNGDIIAQTRGIDINIGKVKNWNIYEW